MMVYMDVWRGDVRGSNFVCDGMTYSDFASSISRFYLDALWLRELRRRSQKSGVFKVKSTWSMYLPWALQGVRNSQPDVGSFMMSKIQVIAS
jgi:hypothetical protein